MATGIEAGKIQDLDSIGWTSGLRYVARQPILDLRARVHGYELLFRNGPDSGFSGDGNLATRTMIDNAVIFGMEKLTGGLPAFVNCTQEALTEQLVDILPPSMTVLEILETLEPSTTLVNACHKLKESGYRIALDDFVWKPKFEPLIQLADYIKVDFSLTDAETRRELILRVKGKGIAMLAEKVETQQEYNQACAEGFTLFQGYYFCRPVLLKNRKIPSNRLFHIEILQLLQSNPIDLNKMSRLVKRDASLTYRLLRLVNSPVCAMRQEVNSIEAALLIVGEETFRRIATLAITSELNADQSKEILLMAFVRSRFCELAAGICGLDSTEQYLLGMMSMLPSMMRLPMEELAPALPLREAIRDALLGKQIKERCLLQWLESHERGEWAQADATALSYELNIKETQRCYAEALIWAETAISSAG